jgi:hypothetical protein
VTTSFQRVARMRRASAIHLRAVILIGIFIIGIVQGIKPLGPIIINSAKASTALDAIPVRVDYESAKADGSVLIKVGPSSRQSALVGHSADHERIDRNSRTALIKNMSTGSNSPTTNRVGAFNGLQRMQDSVTDILNFNVTFDNLSFASADIGNHISQFDILSGSRRVKPLYLANYKARSVSGKKFSASESQLYSSNNTQPDGCKHQQSSSASQPYSGDVETASIFGDPIVRSILFAFAGTVLLGIVIWIPIVLWGIRG